MIFQPLCDFFLRSFNTGLNELIRMLSLVGGKN